LLKVIFVAQVVRNAVANALDGKIAFGLGGAFGLSLSPDGARLLVASWHDQASTLHPQHQTLNTKPSLTFNPQP